MSNVFTQFANNFAKKARETFTLQEYLELCKKDKMAYASAAERMVAAIGEPELIDTHSAGERMSRIFQNRTIKVYPAFREFYGMENTIERIVGFFRHAAQGLEERKQVLYLLGPVGGGKSSLAEKLKSLMEKFPIYVLAYNGELSPVLESPLGLFNEDYAEVLEADFGISKRYITGLLSPWALKRLDEAGGDLSKFSVVRVMPSKLSQIGIAKTEPGDDNNQDISTLVGKVNLHKLDTLAQDDADAYSFSGGLNKATQGLLEFVEMFKAPIKVLHPLLTATQEGNYLGTEAISAIPFQGIILAHSNESEWQKFRNNKNNEAFLDRICVVKVPYCLRKDEEVKIYEKMINASALSGAKIAPQTLQMLAEFAVASRLKEHENSNIQSKLRVYNGESVKDKDPQARALQEYRDKAGVDEGMDGISTRFAYKILSDVLDYDPEEVAADPVHLMLVLEQRIVDAQFGEDKEHELLNYIKSVLAPDYAEFIGKEIQSAYIENSNEYGQSLFDKYIEYADNWIENKDYKDPDTGIMLSREQLEMELEKTEKPARIANPKDFRNEVVRFVMRARGNNGGNNPKWTSYEKLREVIEFRMFSSLEEMLPIISFDSKKSKDADEKHATFIARMAERGYSRRQTRRLVEWFMRVKKAG